MTCRPDGLRNVLMGSEANEDKSTEKQLRPGRRGWKLYRLIFCWPSWSRVVLKTL